MALAEASSEPVARGRVRELLARPPGRPLHGLCLLAALVILVDATNPRLTMWSLFAGVLAGGLAAYWCARLVAHYVVRGAGRRRFLLAPAGALLLAGLILLQVPLQARFAFAHGDFERAVAEVQAGRAVSGTIGTYRISSAGPVEGGVVFYAESGCGVLGDGGFAWLPEGPGAQLRQTFESPDFRHLRGPWYTWCASW